MELSNKQWIAILIIALSALIAGLGYILLPEVMMVQIGFDGSASNSLPKIQALLIPFAISTISAIRYFSSDSFPKKKLFFAILGLVMAVFGFVINYGR